MSIIAILGLLSIGGLLSARDQSILSGATETVLSTIREAQNKSVAVEQGGESAAQEPKGWGVKFDYSSKTLLLSYLYKDYTDTSWPDQKVALGKTDTTVPLDTNVRIETAINNDPGISPDNTTRYIYYTSPFGKLYTNTSSCTWQAADPLKCYWRESTSNSKNWELVNATPFTSTDILKIKIFYKSKSETIIVNANGDSYIE